MITDVYWVIAVNNQGSPTNMGTFFGEEGADQAHALAQSIKNHPSGMQAFVVGKRELPALG